MAKVKVQGEYQYSEATLKDSATLRAFGWLVGRKTEHENKKGEKVFTIRRDLKIANDPKVRKAEATYKKYVSKADKKAKGRHTVGQILAVLFMIVGLVAGGVLMAAGSGVVAAGGKNPITPIVYGEIKDGQTILVADDDAVKPITVTNDEKKLEGEDAVKSQALTKEDFEASYDKTKIKTLDEYMDAFDAYLGKDKNGNLKDNSKFASVGKFTEIGASLAKTLNGFFPAGKEEEVVNPYYTPNFDIVTIIGYLDYVKFAFLGIGAISLISVFCNSARYKKRAHKVKGKYAKYAAKYKVAANESAKEAAERVYQLKAENKYLMTKNDRRIADLGNTFERILDKNSGDDYE